MTAPPTSDTLGAPGGPLIFLDYSGDESLLKPDEHYPVFGAAAVVMSPTAERTASETLREIFQAHGFATREFRMAMLTRGLSGDYRRLRNPKARSEFWIDFCAFVRGADFDAAAVVFDKRDGGGGKGQAVLNVFEAVTAPLLAQVAALAGGRSDAELYCYQRGIEQNRSLSGAVAETIARGCDGVTADDLGRLLPRPPSDGRQNSAAFAIAQVLAGRYCRQTLAVTQKSVLRELDAKDGMTADARQTAALHAYVIRKGVARNSRSTPGV